jgi:hypothetical protein
VLIYSHRHMHRLLLSRSKIPKQWVQYSVTCSKMTPSKRSNMTTRLTVCEVAANENPDAKVQE